MTKPIRVAIVLPGLHRVNRGAEVAFESVGRELARTDGFRVTLFGSGEERAGEPYAFNPVRSVSRERFERWPKLPTVRSDTAWEELTFLWDLRRVYRPEEFDITMTCSFPWTNLWLRKGRRKGSPRHVFVTQNGDWPCARANSEFKWFGCDALVCTNPQYFEAHRESYPCWLIPNGVDTSLFDPGRVSVSGETRTDRVRVLMVSALIPSKRVREGIVSLAGAPEIELRVAGSGPLQDEIDAIGAKCLPGRYCRVSVRPEQMPVLYAEADVVLHMSCDEPFGNVFVEAMSMGKPVVAHNTSRYCWILGEYGYPVDTFSTREVVNAVRAAARDNRGHAIRRHASDRFDWRVIAKAYEQAIRSVLSERHPVAPGVTGHVGVEG